MSDNGCMVAFIVIVLTIIALGYVAYGALIGLGLKLVGIK